MSAPGEVLPLGPDSADEDLGATRPVLVALWAPWCAFSTQMAPVVAELAREFAGRADVVSVDTTTPFGRRLAHKLAVTSIPGFLVLSRGREVARVEGARPKRDLRRALEDAVTPTAHGVAH